MQIFLYLYGVKQMNLLRILKGTLLTFSVVATLFAFQNFASTSGQRFASTQTEQLVSVRLMRGRVAPFFTRTQAPAFTRGYRSETHFAKLLQLRIKLQALVPRATSKFSPQKISSRSSDESHS